MKKHEAGHDGPTDMKSLLILLLLVAVPALGQAAPTPPPLIPAVLEPETIANAPLVEPAQPASLVGRLALELAGGAALGAALAVGGGFLGPRVLSGDAVAPLGPRWTGASVGFVLGAPLGVWVVGALLRSKGSVVATVLASLAGATVGALSVWLAGTDGTPLLFGLPLVGSVIGWEVSGA